MPQNKVSTSPHHRTRKDHSTETAEDYVEAVAEILTTKSLCRLVDLAGHFGVSHVTANRIVARLAREGLVATAPYQPIQLTAKGKRLAATSKDRHEVVLTFLMTLGIDQQTASTDAEGMEHHVSPKTLAAFRKFIESKRT